MLRPPERMTPAQAAVNYIRMNRMGSPEAYNLERTPYMREPMNVFEDRDHDACVFAGPAQSSKTEGLILGSLAYSVKVNPMDMMLVSPTRQNARDFSVLRLDKMHRDSPDIGDMVMTRRDADSKSMKMYTNGMLLFLSWPTISELSGKPIPRMLLTDYDRMPANVEGEGPPFDLARKRTTTFGSYAMTVVESSPGKALKTHKWLARTPHEAPPTDGGILALYNRGDRRRWYWACPHCDDWFEGKFEHLTWEDKGGPVESAETVRMMCPLCGCAIHPDDRFEMNLFGEWLKDGQYFVKGSGKIHGEGERNSIASFWLNGVAAGLSDWQTLVRKYIEAKSEQDKTGNELPLQTFFQTDVGGTYISKAMELQRAPEVLKARSEKLPEREVPADVRFLIACVDVQRAHFSVMVFGISPGAPFDLTVIDVFDVRKSIRIDDDGDHFHVAPASYLEDWDQITEQVIKKTYPLSDGSGRRMMIKMTCCDSGGYARKQHREGVTTNAYNYYRKLKAEGLANRFQLVKGDHIINAPRVKLSYPDAGQKDKLSAARGDVPVLMINSNVVKDSLSARLDCTEPGKGMYRTPDWLPDKFFEELCAETRTDAGWVNLARSRNEAWDLSYYCLAICISPFVSVERIHWDHPPGWCAEWDSNSLILGIEENEKFTPKPKSEYDFSALGRALA